MSRNERKGGVVALAEAGGGTVLVAAVHRVKSYPVADTTNFRPGIDFGGVQSGAFPKKNRNKSNIVTQGGEA